MSTTNLHIPIFPTLAKPNLQNPIKREITLFNLSRLYIDRHSELTFSHGTHRQNNKVSVNSAFSCLYTTNKQTNHTFLHTQNGSYKHLVTFTYFYIVISDHLGSSEDHIMTRVHRLPQNQNWAVVDHSSWKTQRYRFIYRWRNTKVINTLNKPSCHPCTCHTC